MNKTRSRVLLTTAITSVLALAMAVVIAPSSLLNLSRANEQSYNIVLDEDNCPTSSISYTDVTGVTPSRYTVWDYYGVRVSNGNHIDISGESAGFYNTTAILGIASISVNFSSSDSSAKLKVLGADSTSGSYTEIVALTTTSSTHSSAIAHQYIKFVPATTADELFITSVTINYTCAYDPTEQNLATFNAAGSFESENSWDVSSSTGVSLTSNQSYFGSSSLLISGWNESETSEIDTVISYNVGQLAAGSYTLVGAYFMSFATTTLTVGDNTVVINDHYDQGASEIGSGSATAYAGYNSDWTRIKTTFVLASASDVTVSLAVATYGYVSGTSTTWGLMDAFEIVKGSDYLEPVYFTIENHVAQFGATVTAASLTINLYKYSYSSLTTGDIVFASSNTNVASVTGGVSINCLAEGSVNIDATISYGSSLSATTSFTLTIAGNPAYASTIETINAAGGFNTTGSDWSATNCGWTQYTSSGTNTVTYLSSDQKHGGSYSIRPGGNSGIASGTYSTYYIAGLSFEGGKTYTISYYYYNCGNVVFALGVAVDGTNFNSLTSSGAVAFNSTTLSGWAASWQQISFTFTPTADLDGTHSFFFRSLGSGGTGYGFIDSISISVA